MRSYVVVRFFQFLFRSYSILLKLLSVKYSRVHCLLKNNTFEQLCFLFKYTDRDPFRRVPKNLLFQFVCKNILRKKTVHYGIHKRKFYGVLVPVHLPILLWRVSLPMYVRGVTKDKDRDWGYRPDIFGYITIVTDLL